MIMILMIPHGYNFIIQSGKESCGNRANTNSHQLMRNVARCTMCTPIMAIKDNLTCVSMKIFQVAVLSSIPRVFQPV
jgi:hypothetical protein